MAELILCSRIEVRPRLRTEIDRGIVGYLKTSIPSKGLLHPPVVGQDPNIFLVAGLHRKTAIEELHKEGIPFSYNGELVPPGSMPVTYLADLSPADLLEAELEENIIRKEMDWQDRVKALAAIHKLRSEQNPGQTITDTARELEKAGGKATTSESATRAAIKNALLLEQNMHRPSVAKARNATEALGILLKETQVEAEAELIRRGLVKADADLPPIEVVCGDFTEVLPQRPADEVDLIIADLPYGINADKGGFRERTVVHHNYEDTPELARKLLQAIIVEGFRVTKARANLFVFGDIDLFPLFKEACSKMGWKPFRTPIIWQKSESEGLAPWGREGFRRTYECIFFATKGQRGLIKSPIDILSESRVSRSMRTHGAEKPVELLKQLIDCATMPGDFVLDPCCGSGSTLRAIRQTKRRGLGIEISPAYYNLSVVAAVKDPVEETKDDEEDLA